MDRLDKAKKFLKEYYIYQLNKDIIVVSEDKAVLPFMKVIVDDNYPKNLIVSIAADYPRSSEAASIVLGLNKIAKVRLMEEYYIAKNGNTYFGQEAYKYYEFDTHLSLDDIEPECDTKH